MSTVLAAAELLDCVDGRWESRHENLDLEPTAKIAGSLALTTEQHEMREFFDREWPDVPFGD